MAILYYDDKKLFQLNTEKTTYVIGLSPEGYVGHVYYGPLLHGEPDLYPLRIDEPPFRSSRRSPRPSTREKNLLSSTVSRWSIRPAESVITGRAA